MGTVPKLFRPIIPTPPRDPEEVIRWAQALSDVLAKYFRDAEISLLDKRAFVSVEKQLPGAAFTISPNSVRIELYTTVGITSHATTAIKDGEVGQLLILQNVGTATITIKHAANTILKTGADTILAVTNGIMLLSWDATGSNWIEI